MSATSTNCSMSIVRVLRGSTASRSSSVTITVLPLSSSKLRVIDSNGTSLSSSEHQRWVSTGTLSFSWSWRKWKSMSRTALTSATGTFTRPNDSDPVQSARATSVPRRQACLERGHQVARVLRLGALRQRLDLALGLRLDVLEQALAVLVLELLRLELGLERLEQLARHLLLLLRRVARRRGDVEVLHRHELVVEEHRVQAENAVERPHGDEVLAVVEDPPPDPGAVGLLERVVQQPVGILAVVLGAEVVDLVVHDGVDVRGADELLDLDQARLLARGGVELLLLEHDELALRDLVALDDLLVGDLLVLLRADPL